MQGFYILSHATRKISEAPDRTQLLFRTLAWEAAKARGLGWIIAVAMHEEVKRCRAWP